jgi:hypothetical protein
MQLAMSDLFRSHWTEDIHAEWMRNVAADRPDLTTVQLERTRALMDAHVRDCLVRGYESVVPSLELPALELPDENDRHVLAAAIVAGADVILTYNLKDFPDDKLEA